MITRNEIAIHLQLEDDSPLLSIERQDSEGTNWIALSINGQNRFTLFGTVPQLDVFQRELTEAAGSIAREPIP